MVPSFDLLLQGCRLPDGRLVDLGTLDGKIKEIGSLTGRPSHRAVNCGGLVLTPGLVDAHIHLDKALLSERAPSLEGTVTEALRVTAEAKRAFTMDDIRARARRVRPGGHTPLAGDGSPPRPRLPGRRGPDRRLPVQRHGRPCPHRYRLPA